MVVGKKTCALWVNFFLYMVIITIRTSRGYYSKTSAKKIFYQGEKPPETATTFTKSWPRKSYFLGVQVKVSQHTSCKRYACT